MAPMIERHGIVVCHCGRDLPSFMSDEFAVKLERGSLATSPSATAGMQWTASWGYKLGIWSASDAILDRFETFFVPCWHVSVRGCRNAGWASRREVENNA